MNALVLMASVVHCYVGCNSGSEDQQALHVLECDTETGAAKIVQSVKGVQGTTYFQIDREGKYLYSVIGEKKELAAGAAKSGRSKGTVVRFPIDGWKLGEMERLAELPCEAPCHLSLTPDEKRVAFAAYLSATCGTVGIDGKGLASYVFPDDAMGTNKLRQKKAYAHQVFFAPGAGTTSVRQQGETSGLMGVVDLGCDRIRFFNPETMASVTVSDIKFDAGDGPRHALWSKDGKFLFVLCELGSCVYSFTAPKPLNRLTAEPLNFSSVGKWSMLPADFDRWEADKESLSTKAAAIKLTADGKILMASNRGHDSIAFYAVGEDGKLTLRNIAKLTGKFPRDFELMPGEKFMVVGHKMSNEIQVYRFDREACTLTPVGAPIPCWRPLCFKFGR